MATKAEQLAQDWGYEDEYEAAEELITDSICPGICMNPDCDYSTEVEPDCSTGYCEECDTQSVQSLFIIMGIM
jgi:hypothetical protein